MAKRDSVEAIFTPELEEKLRKYYLSSGDSDRHREKLRNEIVEIVLPYVRKIAHGLARRQNDPVEDIVQVGTIGVMKAVEKFNPFAGTSFKTYSTYLITGEIRHYLRDKANMIKAPRQMYELYYRMNQIVQKLSEDLGRPPTDLEIAEELRCPVLKINQAQEVERRRQLVSLDQFILGESGNETVYVEKLVDDKYYELAQQREDRIILEQALQDLKEELQVVVRMAYFEDLNQTEIAQKLGISQMQVSRRLRKALDLLQVSLKDMERPAAAKTQ